MSFKIDSASLIRVNGNNKVMDLKRNSKVFFFFALINFKFIKAAFTAADGWRSAKYETI